MKLNKEPKKVIFNRRILSLVLSFIFSFITISSGVKLHASEKPQAPTKVQVPTLAYDDTSIVLVWDKPEGYEKIQDYNVYMNDKLIGSARENFRINNPYTTAYMDAFYAGDTTGFHVKVDIHTFKATGLVPNTEYKFTVRAVSNGIESEDSIAVVQSTTASPKIFNIKDFGAVDTGRITDYTVDGNNEKIVANTKAIQAAIDNATPGAKVVVPAGAYTAGSLWLKSDMTLELQEGAMLLGSPNADHYPRNYILYDYSTDTRGWAFINAYSKDEGELKNIRIVGKGIIDGNGWKYSTADGKYISDVMVPQKKDVLDPKESQYDLPRYLSGSNTKVTDGDANNSGKAFGILAADSVKKAKALGYTTAEAYSTRPNLVVLRGVEGAYIEGVTLRNPANHGIAFLDSDNIVSNSVIHTSYDDNNGDGIEIGNTKNVIVVGNFFDTGDDTINFATGMGQAVKDSNQRSSSDVWIFDNFLREGHGGAIAAGSHTGAWIERILAEDNVINLNDMPFRFKSNTNNGGGVREIHIRDNAVASPSSQVFVFSTEYSDANQVTQLEPAKEPAVFYNIKAENISVSNTGNAIPIQVVTSLDKKWHTHGNMSFEDIRFAGAKNAIAINGMENSIFKDVTLEGMVPDKGWWTITNSKGLKFEGDTKVSPTTVNASIPPTLNNAGITGISNPAGTEVNLSWGSATDNTAVTKYRINVFLNNEKILETSTTSITTPIQTFKVIGLMPGLPYEFQIEAEDATGNRTAGEKVAIATLGTVNTSNITAPATGLAVTADNTGYTWTRATWNASADPTVRKYEILVDGIKTGQVLNPAKTGTISSVVSGLKPGKDNSVQIVAVNDSGTRLAYNPITVTTLGNYDTDSPHWNKDSAISMEKIDDNSLKLSWQAATDTNEIIGYRVYVDGKPVKQSAQDEFTPVNEKVTTTNTSYVITGLDLVKNSYTFKVEAGDGWWKSKAGESQHHWTLSGPSSVWKVITSFEAVEMQTIEGVAPVLPEYVVAQYNNNTSEKVKVTWASVDTSKVGAQVIEGTVEGTTIKAKLTVNVVAKQIVSIEDAEAVTITQGQKLILPETVLANFDNGLKGKVKVSWSKVDNKKIGEQTIEGTVEGTTLKTILKVKVVNSTTADSKILEELLLDNDIKNVTVEYSTENPIAASNIFNSIKGQDKVVTFENKAKDGTVIASWNFNGKDVTGEIKDIDLTVKAAKLSESDSANKAAIAEKVKNEDAFIISFAANGKLPGKATVKIKLSDSWLEGKDKNNICIYYYNEETKKAEVVAEKLKADAEGYVEFEITHNSDYFAVDKNLVEAETKNPVETEIKNSVEAQIIPKTGSMVDSNVLVGFGVILLLAGLGKIATRKKNS
jgi:LPXTG-motif cell wall-anchored protein